MTIKLSNKHHPAMFPNADCGRARRESESGGSRIVSSHFDAELKKLAKKKKTEMRNQTSAMKEGEERQKRRRRKRRRSKKNQNMLTPFAYVRPPLFH